MARCSGGVLFFVASDSLYAIKTSCLKKCAIGFTRWLNHLSLGLCCAKNGKYNGLKDLAPIVQKLDSSIHRINLYSG